MVSRRQLIKLSALGTASFAAPTAYSMSEMTMSYNTGNPIGSTNPKDLFDNAKNFDSFSNGPSPTYKDRLGVDRKSIPGMIAEFDTDQTQRAADFAASQAAMGYENPAPYAADIVMARVTQLIQYNSELYKAKAGTLSFTTTGIWATDSLKLVSVGDAALRQDFYKAVQYVTPEMFGAVGDLISNDHDALISAFGVGKDVYLAHSYGIGSGLVLTTASNGIRISGPGRIVSSAGSFNTMDLSATTGVKVNISVAAGGLRTNSSDGMAIVCGNETEVAAGTISLYATNGVLIRAKNGCQVFNTKFRNASPVTWDPFNDGNGGSGKTTWTICADVAILASGSRNKVFRNDMQSGGAYGVLAQSLNEDDTGKIYDTDIDFNYIDGYNSYGIAAYRQGQLTLGTGQAVSRTAIRGNTVRNISGGRRSGVFSNVAIDQTFGAGIYIQGAEDTDIEANSLYITNTLTNSETLAPGAIGFANVRDYRATGNKIYGAGKYGIFHNGFGSQGSPDSISNLMGNVVYSSAQGAYKLMNATRLKFEDNDSYKCQFGILCDVNEAGSTKLSIKGGVHESPTNNAINVSGYTTVSIEGVKAYSPGLHGISLSNCIDVTVNDNVVSGAASRAFEFGATLTGLVSASGNAALNSGTGLQATSPVIWDVTNIVYNCSTRFAGTYALSASLSLTQPDATTYPAEYAGDVKFRRVITMSPVGAVNVISLTGGEQGQEITLAFTNANTTLINGSPRGNIYLAAAANKTFATNKAIRLLYNNGLWLEV